MVKQRSLVSSGPKIEDLSDEERSSVGCLNKDASTPITDDEGGINFAVCVLKRFKNGFSNAMEYYELPFVLSTSNLCELLFQWQVTFLTIGVEPFCRAILRSNSSCISMPTSGAFHVSMILLANLRLIH